MKRALLFLGICATCAGSPILAQTPAKAEEATGHYLFIVDTSFSMARQKQTLVRTLSDLILNGLNGQMRPGESFAVWTFNEEVSTLRFTTQIWTPEQREALAERTAQFLNKKRFEKQTHMEKAIAEMWRVVKASKAITVILLSDGDRAVIGTPFDRSLNLAYAERGRELRKARKPFVTALVARGGQILAWAITAAGEPMTLPDVSHLLQTSRPPALPTSAPLNIPTPNLVPQQIEIAAPELKPHQPPQEAPSPSIQRSTVISPTTLPQAAPGSGSEVRPQETSNPKPPSIATNPTIDGPAPSAIPAAAKVEAHAPVADPIPAKERAQPIATHPTVATSSGPSGSIPGESTTLALATTTANSNSYLALGILLLLLALALLFWYLRHGRSKVRSSLISRSLDGGKQ